MSFTKEQVECLEEHLPYGVLMLRYTFGKLATVYRSASMPVENSLPVTGQVITNTPMARPVYVLARPPSTL